VRDTRVRTARLSDEQLAAAYSGAVALLFPSRYEGFGLPILEAMACGCPVITCATSAIPEVAGDAAIYVSPDDANELAGALRSLSDPVVRKAVREKGLEQARRFDWSSSAQAVGAFLLDVAGRPTRTA
jgi:glycosyltransferase involved in cell wall biosynthesis